MKTIHTLLLALALGTGSGYAAGCTDDDGSFTGVSDIRIGSACSDYCDQAHTCSDTVDVDRCKADCEDNIMDCMADEQEETVDDIEGCADASCNDFAGCTIGASLQCTFGV